MTSSGVESIGNLVLDTSAYSRFRARHSLVADHIARAAVVLLPVTVLGELEAAFLLGTRTAENGAALTDFLAEQFVRVLEVTHEVAKTYGMLFAQLRRTGTPISVNDVWIAAATIESGGHLLTFDRDFDRIEGLPHTVLGG
jgi:tRNA(fMet)-specific endonuclease VapC